MYKRQVYDSGDYIEVYAELKRIGGKLEGTSNLQWEDTVAEWDEIDGAKSYEVKLLRDEKTVTTVSTTGTSCLLYTSVWMKAEKEHTAL